MVVAVCPIFADSLLASVVEDLRGASRICLWSLDGVAPDALAPFIQGSGKLPRMQVFNELMPHYANSPDGVLFVDDDVVLAEGFVQRFLTVVRELGADVAQPALTLDSHYSHPVTRHRPGLRARRTNFVEVGPAVWMGQRFLKHALPFPVPKVMSWGVDFLWSRIATQHGLRMLIVDATPIKHAHRPVASKYSKAEATKSCLQFMRQHNLQFPDIREYEAFGE
jgi:hypothetical protein